MKKKISFTIYYLCLAFFILLIIGLFKGNEEHLMTFQVESAFITKQKYKTNESIDHNLLLVRPDGKRIELGVSYGSYFQAKKALKNKDKKYMTFSLTERHTGIPPKTFFGKHHTNIFLIFFYFINYDDDYIFY